MPATQIVPWSGKEPVILPAGVIDPREIVKVARQLSVKDRQQIVSAFSGQLYEMVAAFVWNKAITSLKAQLGKLGTAFIAEMLDRPDIDSDSPLEQKLTDFEALKLARELGVIGGTGAFRLRQAFERVNHFGSTPSEESEEDAMSADEAVGVLKACVTNILGFERIEAALDFKDFRDSLGEQTLSGNDESVVKLANSPYFFKRACIRMLLALVKSTLGAELENALANANVLIPKLWDDLLKPDRHQVGRVYAELMSEGKSIAASGMKKALLKVGGFDFVPEDLRSRAFMAAAHAVIEAHEGMNNFYNEPAPTKALERMGSVIPVPAFPICMSALLSVRLGNLYSISYGAQAPAISALKRVSPDRWAYYLSECLPADDRILYKLLQDRPATRWSALVGELGLAELASELTNKDIRNLVTPSTPHRFQQSVERIVKSLGYASKA
ncbi:MAG TPA: hypothetical protein VHY84_03850 [Bryobacteraceae bacterium]|jgi:hypothetical protein|nr:hypothetical protein [Bryobacteraceae bacterium]